MKGAEYTEDAVTYIDYDLFRIVDILVVHIKRFY